MKPLKFLTASLLALSVAGTAQAQTVVHITGSTAFRNATVTAITNILQPGFTFGYAGTSFTGANQGIFTGTTISNVSVVIKTSWSGAAGGVQAVVQQLPLPTWLTNTTPQSATGTANAPSVYDPPAPAEVSMDDGIQATTPLPNTSSPVLTVQNVGVVTFKFLKNVGAPAGLTNMTPLLAQALWVDGSLPLSMWTGNATDTNLVYATGRDPDSGTRKTAFLETGVQNYVSSVTPTTVLQWEPTNAAGQVVNRSNPGPITGVTAWPLDTVDGVSFPVGDAGYSSGGDLAAAMKTTSPVTFVTYLGLSDAATAEGGGAVDLTWNGVAYTDAAIRNGQYTFWAYEQLGYLPNGTQGAPSANAKSVADELAAQIINSEAALAGELLSTMNVSRPQEGAPVAP